MKKIKKIIFLIIICLFIRSIVFANDTLVYVDSHDIDTRYHRLTCSFIPREYQAISVETAFVKGFRSCPICEPPISDAEQKLRDEEYQERYQKAQKIINSVSSNTNNSSNNNISSGEQQYSNRLQNILNSTYTGNSDSSNTSYVYVTSTGSKYHEKGCDYLNSTPHKLTVTEAENRGYTPCKVCNPYNLANDEKENNPNNKAIFILVIALIVLIIYIIFNEIKYKKSRMEK